MKKQCERHVIFYDVSVGCADCAAMAKEKSIAIDLEAPMPEKQEADELDVVELDYYFGYSWKH